MRLLRLCSILQQSVVEKIIEPVRLSPRGKQFPQHVDDLFQGGVEPLDLSPGRQQFPEHVDDLEGVAPVHLSPYREQFPRHVADLFQEEWDRSANRGMRRF